MLAGDKGLEPLNGGIKIRCLTNLANPQQKLGAGRENMNPPPTLFGAANEVRTRDVLLGKQVLYQLSYSRI